MTKHEIEVLKKGYQRKCLAEMHCRRRGDSEGAAGSRQASGQLPPPH